MLTWAAMRRPGLSRHLRGSSADRGTFGHPSRSDDRRSLAEARVRLRPRRRQIEPPAAKSSRAAATASLDDRFAGPDEVSMEAAGGADRKRGVYGTQVAG